MGVQCVQCKMLTIIHPESKERIEADQDFRKIGRYDYNSHGRPKSYIPTVVCHVGERSELPSQRFIEKLDMVALLCKEIECDKFEPYVPGIGPKQIDEMNSQQVIVGFQKDLLTLQQSVFDWRREQAAKDDQQAARDRLMEQQIHALQEVRHQESITVGKDQAWGSRWQAYGTLGAFFLAAASFALTIWMWFHPPVPH